MQKERNIFFFATLVIWAILSPYVSVSLLELVPQPVLALIGYRGDGNAPGLFAFSFVAAFAVQPGLLKRYFSSKRQALRSSILWAAIGTVVALTLGFFAGALGQLNVVYPFVAASVFAAGALGVHLVCSAMSAGALITGGLSLALIALATSRSGQWFPAAPPQSFAEAARFVALSPLTVLLAFAASFFFARRLRIRLFGFPTTLAGKLVSTAFWIVALHATWLILLFVVGAVQIVPRWLPVLTATLLALPALLRPAYGALRGASVVTNDEVYDMARAAAPGVQPELERGSLKGRGKRVWIISYTGVSNEPRVLRQAEAMVQAGWDVVVCGYDGHSKRPDTWHFLRLPTTENFRNRTLRALAAAGRIGRWMAASRLPAPIAKWGGRLAHGSTPLWLHTRLALTDYARNHPELMADLVISHDYHTADVGYAIAKVFGAKFSMDIHEYAAGQYFNDPQWVKWQRPVSIATQEYYLARADVVTVVCEGIGKLLYEENKMKAPPITIRSVPFLQAQPFRPTGERIRVLYHGDISPRREILAAVESMRMWRSDIDLVLRGASDPAYMGEIKRLIARLGLEKRVFIEDPVPFNRIVPEANKADIGYFSFKGGSPQIRFTLPNKLFEYVMGGLCLVVGDTDEVATVVNEHRLGVLIPEHNPTAIANAINNLTREQIDAFKHASVKAAQILNWEHEQRRMLDAYNSLG